MRAFICLAIFCCAPQVLAQDALDAAAAAPPAPTADFTEFTGELTIATVDGPRIRLEQDGTPSAPPYTWDFGGDEREFFVIDVSAGTMPLRLSSQRGGARLVIASDGNWGVMGNANHPLHIWRSSDGAPRLLVEETSTAIAARNLARFVNNGPPIAMLFGGPGEPDWRFGMHFSGDFFVGAYGLATKTSGSPAGPVPDAFRLTPAGHLTLAGTLTQLSDRGSKRDLAPVDDAALLARLAALPVSTWSYKGERARHLGPMAQAFAAAFGLGADAEHVALSDLAGVSLAAMRALGTQARGLAQRVEAADAGLAHGARRGRELQQRLDRLAAGLRQADGIGRD